MIRVFVAFIIFLPSLAWGSDGACARIVSLAPSVTEVLFELGIGDRVVGVTHYCRFPPEAQHREHIGGFYDINVEKIVSLRPDLVVALPEHASIRQTLERLRVPVLQVDHATVSGIKESFRTISHRCGNEDKADARLAELSRREESLRTRFDKPDALKTLVVVGRTHEGSSVSSIYVSGNDGFYSSVLSLLGMKNVNADSTISLPTISPEGILALNPDVIVEVVGQDDPIGVTDRKALWSRYPQLSAVKRDRVVVLSSDYATIPGPRYVELAEDLAQAVYGVGGEK